MRESIPQLPPILACLWSGFALGLVYDLLRFIRSFGGAVAAAVCDLFFGVSAFVLIGGALVVADMGRLRLLSLPIAAAAFFIWQGPAGRPLRALAFRIRYWLHGKKEKRTRLESMSPDDGQNGV